VTFLPPRYLRDTSLGNSSPNCTRFSYIANATGSPIRCIVTSVGAPLHYAPRYDGIWLPRWIKLASEHEITLFTSILTPPFQKKHLRLRRAIPSSDLLWRWSIAKISVCHIKSRSLANCMSLAFIQMSPDISYVSEIWWSQPTISVRRAIRSWCLMIIIWVGFTLSWSRGAETVDVDVGSGLQNSAMFCAANWLPFYSVRTASYVSRAELHTYRASRIILAELISYTLNVLDKSIHLRDSLLHQYSLLAIISPRY